MTLPLFFTQPANHLNLASSLQQTGTAILLWMTCSPKNKYCTNVMWCWCSGTKLKSFCLLIKRKMNNIHILSFVAKDILDKFKQDGIQMSTESFMYYKTITVPYSGKTFLAAFTSAVQDSGVYVFLCSCLSQLSAGICSRNVWNVQFCDILLCCLDILTVFCIRTVQVNLTMLHFFSCKK